MYRGSVAYQIFVLIFTLLSINSLVLSSKMIAWKSTTILLVYQIYVVTYIVFLLASRTILYYFASKRFELLYLLMFTYVLVSIALLAIGLFETRGMHAHFIDAKRDRTRESAVAHRNTYPSFDASGPEPVLKAFRKAPEPPVVEDEKTNVRYTSEPVLKSFRKLSHLIRNQQTSPVAPKVAMDRKRSPSAEDYLDFESPKPPKNPENTKNEKRNGSFDDVLAELAKRQAEMQEY
ncbi:hypothetical protein PRIPAC_76681 [Pristionchus pacificus]|uniref:Uncharacterized protein n=1 Tax=Pristionchus pacificus TaxID=54126 RepID=A0A2A6C778_PRIPA|nr:hypothetical protein PRIPAC_76681 [Pristionchus pacificus]|eukprot:PDM73956.1 hypothetical protein PRIPAC_41312 [Pristionchus pacificus]